MLKNPKAELHPLVRQGNLSLIACLITERSLTSRGFLSRTASLMLNARRKSSSDTYSSPWRKWLHWSSERGHDSYNSPITVIADFLTDCFEQGLSASYIGVIRSSISCYHAHIDGYQVGKHPYIVMVLGGVKTQRPAVDRLPMVWNADQVISFLKILGRMEDLSLRILTYKTVMLVSLANIPRASDIVGLKINRMSSLPESLVFFFDDPRKHERERSSNFRSKAKDPLEIYNFEEDMDLCPVTFLNHYVERTSVFRKNENQIFLALPRPHNKVKSETVGRWIKEILKRAGIDIDKFTAHSSLSQACLILGGKDRRGHYKKHHGKR